MHPRSRSVRGVGNGALVGQLQRIGAEPLDVNDRNCLVREDPANIGSGLEVLELQGAYAPVGRVWIDPGRCRHAKRVSQAGQ
jgi:hypothetical protein